MMVRVLGVQGIPQSTGLTIGKKVYDCDYWDKCKNARSFDNLEDSEKIKVLEWLQKIYQKDHVRFSLDIFKNRIRI
jgi:hypothetical protein